MTVEAYRPWGQSSNINRNKRGHGARILVSESREEARKEDRRVYLGTLCKNPSHRKLVIVTPDGEKTIVGTIRRRDGGSCCWCNYNRSKKVSIDKLNEKEGAHSTPARRQRIEAIREARELGIDPKDLM